MEFFEIIKKTNFDFLSQRKKAFLLSSSLVALGLFALLMVSLGKANMSVDFTGGLHIHLRFSRQIPVGELREVLREGGIDRAQIQEIRGTTDFFIKTKYEKADPNVEAERVSSVLKSYFGEKDFQILGVTTVGPSVGRELKRNAIIAIVIAVISIVIYIAWRFTFVFGVAATIATFHDVLAVLGIFYVLGKEINILLITALLTIAGYSLTDTIVVFDRIRENMSKLITKFTFEEIINRSINEVLSRTIITSLTTLLAISAILLLGGPVLFDFSLALFLGVVIGTYSSVFVASPLVYVWRRRVL
ncbi:MAG: protein translocase subunit SecF [Desulfobacterota bacterium]|nr:protein translocase subunit SecF [Thermodesulfobacteriota bacterium]